MRLCSVCGYVVCVVAQCVVYMLAAFTIGSCCNIWLTLQYTSENPYLYPVSRREPREDTKVCALLTPCV